MKTKERRSLHMTHLWLYPRGHRTIKYHSHSVVPSEISITSQYIGIKDKKDKEIYEWDIIKYCDLWGHNENDPEISDVKPAIGIVYWNTEQARFSVDVIQDGEFKLKGEKHKIVFYDYDGIEFNWRDVEVITIEEALGILWK